MKIKVIATLGFILLTGSCLFLLAACTPKTARAEAEASPLASSTLIEVEPTKTQALPTVTPTLNSPATVAAMNMTTAADNVKSAGIEAAALVDAARISANAISTQTAGDLLMLEKSETGLTNRELIKLTAQAVELAIKQADAQIAEAENEAERLRQDGQTSLVKQIMGWLTAFLACVFIGVFSWRFLNSRQTVDYRESGDSIEADEVDAQPWPDFAAGVKTGLFANIVTREELRKIGGAVLSGRPFSHTQIVRTLGVMSEDDFTALQDKFIVYGLATWRNAEHHKQGCIITPKGNQFFFDIGCQTTPPLTSQAPVAPELGDKDAIRNDFTPL